MLYTQSWLLFYIKDILNSVFTIQWCLSRFYISITTPLLSFCASTTSSYTIFINTFFSPSLANMSNDSSSLINTIGDVLGPFNLSVQLRITYNSKPVINGCDLRPTAIVNRPIVEVGGEDFRVSHTLVIWHLLTYISYYISYV